MLKAPLPYTRPHDALAGLAKRPVSQAALDQADRMQQLILNDTSELALRPHTLEQLTDACQQMQHINSWTYSINTVIQDNSSHWRYWTNWCAQWRATPVRVYYHTQAPMDQQLIEKFLWASALPWILGHTKPGPGRTFPLPSSAAHVLRGVRRVHITLGYEPPPPQL